MIIQKKFDWVRMMREGCTTIIHDINNRATERIVPDIKKGSEPFHRQVIEAKIQPTFRARS